jgi:hypothetical protein
MALKILIIFHYVGKSLQINGYVFCSDIVVASGPVALVYFKEKLQIQK